MSKCPFCTRIERQDYSAVFRNAGDITAVAFEPLRPVTEGHLLYVPVIHVQDALAAPLTAGTVLAHAAAHSVACGIRSVSLITSAGADATQSVWNLHVHAVPRRPGDGLMLPWSMPCGP